MVDRSKFEDQQLKTSVTEWHRRSGRDTSSNVRRAEFVSVSLISGGSRRRGGGGVFSWSVPAKHMFSLLAYFNLCVIQVFLVFWTDYRHYFSLVSITALKKIITKNRKYTLQKIRVKVYLIVELDAWLSIAGHQFCGFVND